MVSEFITLDGVVEAPGGEPGHPNTGWVFDYHGPELERFNLEELRDAESMLLGRVTHQGFAEVWPSRKGEIADLLNSMRKRVVSSTLTTPLAWSNSRLLAGELATAVTELKQGDGGPILSTAAPRWRKRCSPPSRRRPAADGASGIGRWRQANLSGVVPEIHLHTRQVGNGAPHVVALTCSRTA
jgi:hypothetical protein